MAIGTNLVSYWQWESGLTDTMGTYNGTIGGAGSLSYVASMTGFGQCMDLTPSKYVTFGTVSAYGAGSFSVSCWFNSDVATSGAYYTILGQSDGSYLGFNIFTDTAKSGRIRFEIGTDGVNWRSIWSTNAPSTSTWYHLVVVVDRVTNSAQMYIDGVLQSHASDTGAAAGSLSVVGTIGTKLNYWCAADVVGWNQWDGKIDDCAIWNRALTAGEALQIYNAGAAGSSLQALLSLETSLVSYWPFDSSTNDAFGSDNGTGTGGLSYAASMSGFSDAIDCSGSDYVTFGAPTYGTSSLTFSYWVKPAGLGAGKYQIIGDNRTGSYVGISIFCNGPNDYFRCELSSGAGYSNTYSTNVPVAGTWYHLVVVVDRSTNTQRMYVDGVLQSNASDSPSIAGYGSLTNSTFYIGTANTAGISIWEGLIDDAAWWTRALTPAEITAIYNAGAAASPLSSLLPHVVLKGLFGSVVHNAPPSALALEGVFGSLVHSVPTPVTKLEGMWGSLVHSVPAPTAVVPDITGSPGVPATFDGSASTTVTYYHWSWVSVPGGSSIANAAIPFPDNQAAAPLDMTDNEGLWHFEGNANDTSGNARNGTVTGASLVTGKVGAQAYQFGVADKISFGAASAFISANFSISFWLKGDSAWTPAVYDSIVGASNAFTWNQGFGAFWHNATTIRFFVGSYNGNYVDLTVTPANWNHIVFTWDGSNIIGYLNGSAVSTNAHTAALTGLTNDFYASWLGTHGGGEQTIDELALWSRAISAAEVASIYAAQNGTLAALGSSTFTFTPDVVGTYTVKLAINASVNTNADAVISVPSGGGPTSQGESLQGGGLQGSGLEGSI